MATTTNDEREDSIRHVLARVNEDLRHYAPPDARYAPPGVQHHPAAAINTELVGAGDGAAETIMMAVEEVEKKAAALRENAERGMKGLKDWTNEFAQQHAQLLQEMNELSGRINESVERITQIGTKPPGGNGRHE